MSWGGKQSVLALPPYRRLYSAKISPAPCLVRFSAWSKLETRRRGVQREHVDRIKRQIAQIHAGQLQRFVENIVRHRHDVATAVIGLQDVQYLPNARP